MTHALTVVLLSLAVSATTGAEPSRLFVSPGGSDRWSGTLAESNAGRTDGPLATIEGARNSIRKIKAATGLPGGGITVELAGGRYELARPVALTAEDSGTAEAPIVYLARPGQKVRISGGRIVTGWTPVTDPAVLNRLDPAARGKVFQTDLKAQGIAEYGDLGLDAAWELQLWLARVDYQGEDAMGSTYALSLIHI